MALTVSLPAQTPASAKSTIVIKLATKFVVEPKPEKRADAKPDDHDCYGDVTIYSLEPTFIKGLDATSSNLVLNIYALGKTEKTEKPYISAPFTQIISNNTLAPDNRYKSYKFRCGGECSKVKKRDAPEWFAEVLMDGKSLCTTQSKTSSAVRQLIETRVIATSVAMPK